MGVLKQKMINRPIVISHGEDPDGIISMALLMRHLRSCNVSASFGFGRYSNISETFIGLAKLSENCLGEDFYVLDLGINGHLLSAKDSGENVIKKLAHNTNLHWVDHHDTTKGAQPHLEEMGVDLMLATGINQCSSRIVYANFLNGDAYCDWLSKIALEHDNPGNGIHPELGNDLQKIISLNYYGAKSVASADFNLLRLVNNLSFERAIIKGKFNRGLQRLIDKYDELEKSALNTIYGTAQLFESNDLKIIFAYGNPLLPQKDGLRKMAKMFSGQADIYCLALGNPVNNVMMLSVCDFDASHFSQSCGGGGRANIGGYINPAPITVDNIDEVAEGLKDNLANYVA